MSHISHIAKKGPVRPERGQAIAEFAIAAIPMLLLLIGILQFGLIYNAQVGLTNAIRDAARYGSGIVVTDATSAGTAATSVQARLAGSLGNYVSPYYAGNLVSATACYSQHVDGTSGGASPAWVSATVVYDHPLVVPLIGAIIDALDGTSNNAFRISVSTEIRVDNPTQATVTIPVAVCRS